MTVCDGWDTHSKNFEGLQSELLPMVDQSLSALLDDLDQRGRLEETLVLCLGEFGRTPEDQRQRRARPLGALLDDIRRRRRPAHRPGDRRVGQDRRLSHDRANSPVDIHATMYHALGIEPASASFPTRSAARSPFARATSSGN